MRPDAPQAADPHQADQAFYARWLAWASRAALLATGGCFAAYAAGWWAPQVGIAVLIADWHLPVGPFLARTGAPHGWAWLARLDRADMACLGGLALLTACPMPALAALLLRYWRRGERLACALVLAQLAVLVLAAAGLTGVH